MVGNFLKHWSLVLGIILSIVAVGTLLINYGAKNENIESRIFDTGLQKEEVIDAFENLPTESERAVSIADSKHAVEIRQLRYDNNLAKELREEEAKRIQDSLTIDSYKRFTVQLEQLEQKIDEQNKN